MQTLWSILSVAGTVLLLAVVWLFGVVVWGLATGRSGPFTITTTQSRRWTPPSRRRRSNRRRPE